MRGGGGNRGRGGYRNYSGGRFPNNFHHNNRFGGGYHNPKPFIPHVPFDFVQVEHAFQRVKPIAPQDDKNLNDLLIKRNQDLTSGPTEQGLILNLLTKIQTVLETLILAPGDFEACTLDEIKQVGSYKKGTMMVSHKQVADICVVLKTLPTKEAVSQLANKVFEDVKKTLTPNELKALQVNCNDSGFEIVLVATSSSAIEIAVQVLITTQAQNLRKLEPELHLDARICHRNLSSIKQARWFEENAPHPTIKVLIRLLKDVAIRFEGLQPLNPWLIDLLAHYAIMNNPKREALPLSIAFRRVFQLLSAGFFLPGSAGINDPCENAPIRVHTILTLEQQDMVCYTCQTLLRILAHGGLRQLIGLEGNAMIASTPSVWAGVVVTPSSKVYEPKEIEHNISLVSDSGDADGEPAENGMETN